MLIPGTGQLSFKALLDRIHQKRLKKHGFHYVAFDFLWLVFQMSGSKHVFQLKINRKHKMTSRYHMKSVTKQMFMTKSFKLVTNQQFDVQINSNSLYNNTNSLNNQLFTAIHAFCMELVICP